MKNEKLGEFVKTYVGRKVDYDGRYGCQCVDLFRLYTQVVLDIPQCPPVEGAKDLFKNHGNYKKIKHFDDVLYKAGDVLVWDSNPRNPYGHVAICLHDFGDCFLVLEQDGFRQNGVQIVKRYRHNLLGALIKNKEVIK